MSAYTSDGSDGGNSGDGMIPNVKFEDGKPITPRVRTVAEVRSIHEQCFQNDIARRYERSQVQAMLANKQPFDPAAMKAAGLSGCSNQDFRYGSQAIRREMAPYVSMWRSLPTFLRIVVSKGETSQRDTWCRIIAEQHAIMIRACKPLYFRYLSTVQSMVSHGIGWAFFDNKYDWRWQIAQAGEFLVPEFTKADTSEFDIATGIREFQSSWLFAQIKGCPKDMIERSKEDKNLRWNGWHPWTVIQAIEHAIEKPFYTANDWDLYQRIWETNQIFWSRTAKVIRCITQLIQEGDGTVTQYTCLANDDPNANDHTNSDEIFLYQEEGKYEAMGQGLIMFRDSIGTDSYLHTIHGRGAQMFPMIRKLTELKNRLNDAITIEMSIPITGTAEALSSELVFIQSGPWFPILKDVTLLDRDNKDFTKSAIPALEMLEKDLYNVQAQPTTGQDNQEMEALFAQFNGVDEMSFSLFMVSWDELLKESFRRGKTLMAGMPGYKEWKEFKDACLDEGVPIEIFDSVNVRRCSAVAPIGFGSPIAKYMAMQGMEKLVPYMDEKGKNNWARNTAAALPGVDNMHVDEYIPAQQGTRPGPETSIATLENFPLMDGKEVQVLPDQPHFIHIPIHFQPMMSILEQVEQGALDIAPASEQLFQLYVHTEDHLEAIGDDPLQQPLINQWRKGLHNMGEIIVNGQRKLRAEQEKQAQEGGGQQTPQNSLSDEQLMLLAKAQTHIADAQNNNAIKASLHQQELADSQQDRMERQAKLGAYLREQDQKLKINDAKAATDISTKLKQSETQRTVQIARAAQAAKPTKSSNGS